MDAAAFCGWSFGTCNLYAVIVIVTNPAIIILVTNPAVIIDTNPAIIVLVTNTAVIIDTNPAIIIVTMSSWTQLHFVGGPLVHATSTL